MPPFAAELKLRIGRPEGDALCMQGLLRRGLTVAALREFMMAQGASRMVTYQEWEKLWTFNKKIVDPVCPRHTAVKSDRKVLLKLKDVAQTDYVTIPRHKKNPETGKKTTMRSPVGCSHIMGVNWQ